VGLAIRATGAAKANPCTHKSRLFGNRCGGGVTGKLTRNLSVYGDASYLTSVSGESRIALKGNVGLRVTW
jgi:outer membrane autotransporter protein